MELENKVVYLNQEEETEETTTPSEPEATTPEETTPEEATPETPETGEGASEEETSGEGEM